MRSKPVEVTRRTALGLIAVTAGGGVFHPTSARAQAGYPASPLLLEAAGVCAVTPETTEGPFYFDPELERADIREDRKGIHLAVRLQVVDARCIPVSGARVDVWHCDAGGHYSGYPGQGDGRDVDTTGQKFLRGWQRADANGIVSFDTVYPGWYRGRTTHAHFKVFPDEASVATGQMFFPEDINEHVFATVAPYTDRRRQRDTMNADDGILRRAGPSVQAAVHDSGQVLQAEMIIAVQNRT
jgi:protocatechuate 3,4-dioxygenase beta subunit